MITVQASCPIVVFHPVNGSMAYTAGVWQFDELTTLRGYTNQIVNVSGLADGAIVVVDVNGWQSVTPGVNLEVPAMLGFIVSLMTVGLFLGIRWVVRFVSRTMGGGGIE